MSHHVVEKVCCGLCGHFLGIITSDGKGPILDDCHGDRLDRSLCPMLEQLEQYQPLRIHRRGRDINNRQQRLTMDSNGQ